eukprot:117802-Prorocentrum_minimum.AAC.1
MPPCVPSRPPVEADARHAAHPYVDRYGLPRVFRPIGRQEGARSAAAHSLPAVEADPGPAGLPRGELPHLPHRVRQP